MNISPSSGPPVFFSSLYPAHNRCRKYICFYYPAIFILHLYGDIFAYDLDLTFKKIRKIISDTFRMPNTIIYGITGTYLV